jgi:broad specificity phosphatase PhoE
MRSPFFMPVRSHRLRYGMHITLMRHGKPILASRRWRAPCDMGEWIAQYDRAEADSAGIPAASLAAARSCTHIFASTLPRARFSAEALGYAAPRLDALFCEAALPSSSWRFPRLPPALWAALLRIAWLLGYARGAATLAAETLRARQAANCLVAAAAEGPVLLVGHGIMNRLIARELRRSGWTSTNRQRSGYWSAVRYTLPGSVTPNRSG